MDIYFLQSILNIIWYVFSILFVLYKFTSFFSYIWNFIKFLGKFTKGIAYAVEQFKIFITKRNNQRSELPRYDNENGTDDISNYFTNRGIDIRDDPGLRRNSKHQSFFTKTKTKLNNLIFGKPNHNYIPLTDTRLSYINSNLIETEINNTKKDDTDLTLQIKKNDLEKSMFAKHIDSAMQSNYSDASDMDGFKNVKINFQSSSFYPPPHTKNNNDSYMQSSLLNSELTENPFAEELSNNNLDNRVDNQVDNNLDNKDDHKQNENIDSNVLFESTFIKKWLK